MHEVLGTKDAVEIRLLDVIIFNCEPALVWKEGVTVNEMELSLVCIQEILFGSPSLPVKAVI